MFVESKHAPKSAYAGREGVIKEPSEPGWEYDWEVCFSDHESHRLWCGASFGEHELELIEEDLPDAD